MDRSSTRGIEVSTHSSHTEPPYTLVYSSQHHTHQAWAWLAGFSASESEPTSCTMVPDRLVPESRLAIPNEKGEFLSEAQQFTRITALLSQA